MLLSPEKSITSAFSSYIDRRGEQLAVDLADEKATRLPVYRIGDRTLVLFDASEHASIANLLDEIRATVKEAVDGLPGYEILLVPTRGPGIPMTRIVVARGLSLMSLHDAIGTLIGLPDGWRESQERLVGKTLEPLTLDGEVNVASLFVEGDEKQEAFEWLSSRLESWSATQDKLVYLRAEAGKGKSTLFAETVRRQLQRGTGPLPLYLPLRQLQRGAGVSWGDIASCAGILGKGADELAAAATHGLAALLLDGLDEVSGRYDPNLVKGVIDVIKLKLEGRRSIIFLSGRTTEATFLNPQSALEIGIELPESQDTAFAEYCSLVINKITPEWPKVSRRVPEPPYSELELQDRAPSTAEQKTILDWIGRVFDELGKERSLFFVQSLACVGRTYQLDGNQPFLIPTREEPARRAPLYDVCVLAATLASVREQDKVEDLARESFTPAAQLDLLTLFALRSSTAGIGEAFAQPNELAQQVFNIDPVNENEAFTAIVRQMQKHALLFAGLSEGLRTGEWRPTFLSDWVRAALVARAWQRRDHLASYMDSGQLEKTIARASRVAYTFGVILPELVEKGDRLKDWLHLVDILRTEANQGSPEACENFWRLACAISDDARNQQGDLPAKMVELADLSDLHSDAISFDNSFSSNLVTFVAADFSHCEFNETHFTSCDLSDAIFTNCDFDGASFLHCDGPVLFDGCKFTGCHFEDLRMRNFPAIRFIDCEFQANNSLVQHRGPSDATSYQSSVVFENCICEDPAEDWMEGEWLGVNPRNLEGLRRDYDEAPSKIDRTLRGLLNPFFPRRVGSGDQRQARGYIRSSALGRGVWPDGAPTGSELMDILLSSGFTTGGREGHVYAPWSSVVGSGDEAMEIRNELLAYLHNRKRGPFVDQLIEKIQRAAEW